MKITHTINNNKVIITGRLELRKYINSKEISITIKEVEEYIRKNNIPVGEAIYTSAEASNKNPDLLEATWEYYILKEFKKSLTQPAKTGKVNTRKKNSTARTRARKIVSNKKANSKKDESNNTKSTNTNSRSNSNTE